MKVLDGAGQVRYVTYSDEVTEQTSVVMAPPGATSIPPTFNTYMYQPGNSHDRISLPRMSTASMAPVQPASAYHVASLSPLSTYMYQPPPVIVGWMNTAECAAFHPRLQYQPVASTTDVIGSSVNNQGVLSPTLVPQPPTPPQVTDAVRVPAPVQSVQPATPTHLAQDYCSGNPLVVSTRLPDWIRVMMVAAMSKRVYIIIISITFTDMANLPESMEVVWHGQFDRLFSTFPQQWRLVPLATRNTEHFDPSHYTVFQDSAKVRFLCKNESCCNAWTSMKGRVIFWIKPPQPHQLEHCGIVRFKLFGQKCQKCKPDAFEHALWYPQEAAKVVYNLYIRVGQLHYAFARTDYLRDRRTGKPRQPHKSELCQACANNTCREAAAMATNRRSSTTTSSAAESSISSPDD